MDENFIRIDFSQIKSNLYQILGVENTTSMKKIKKAYRKLILLHHPDKNKDADDELFNKITMAYQVLSNKNYRKKYNKWLKLQLNEVEYEDLHEKWKKYKDSEKNKNSKHTQDYKKNFIKKTKELEQKHFENTNYNFNDSSNLDQRLTKLHSERNKINIKKEKINNFNNEFDNRKIKKEDSHQIIKLNDDIISYDQINATNYTSISNINKLYLDDENISTKNFSSLNCAFSMYKCDKFNDNNLTLEEKIKLHEKEINELKNLDFTKYK